jgi:serine/threonine protein kinase
VSMLRRRSTLSWSAVPEAASRNRVPLFRRTVWIRHGDFMLTRLGDYEVLRVIGAGGMATAFLGRTPTGRLVVLKVPLESTPEGAIKLRDEAQAGLRVRHPHVVETIDFFVHEGRPILVLGFIEGCALRDLRQLDGRPNPLPPAAVAWLGRNIAEGLAAIHDAVDEEGRPLKMLHRDVTPSNVLVGRDGAARLIDLGIARSDENQQERTKTGVVKGTLRYVAPELLAGAAPTMASDLWGLGVCLLEAATGRQMVSGEPIAVFRFLTTGEYNRLRVEARLQRDLSDAIFALVADVSIRLRNARAAAAVFARIEQKLLAEGADTRSGAVWLQEWVPRAIVNENDVDGGAGTSAESWGELTSPSLAASSSTAPQTIIGGPADGSAPTLTVPRIDLPASPGLTRLSVTGPTLSLRPHPSASSSEPPPVASLEPAPGDVLPAGAATIRMPAWSPDVAVPEAPPAATKALTKGASLADLDDDHAGSPAPETMPKEPTG